MSGDAGVAAFAVLYLRARSWGLPAALVMMVAIGSARGVKDMNIPLLGSLAYLLALVAGDLLFLFGLHWGMEGAGLAAAAAQWVGAATVCALLARKQVGGRSVDAAGVAGVSLGRSGAALSPRPRPNSRLRRPGRPQPARRFSVCVTWHRCRRPRRGRRMLV